MSNTSRSLTEAVTEAYLAITQDISQSLEAQQLILLSCDSKEKRDQCDRCTLWWFNNSRSFNPQPSSDYINKMCAPVCSCDVKNVDMSQTILINFSAFMQDSAKSSFFNQVTNSLAQKATQEESGIPTSNTKNSEDTINSLFEKMQSDTIQTAIQGLSAMQIITLQGTGSVAVVNMNQAIDFISTILENNAEVSSELQKLENQIIQESTQITRAGLEEIIEWIIQIVLFVVILFALFYTIDLIFQVYFFAL